jgi:cytosine/adenosine deaminase-related metal-dependent hydrolase
MLLTAPLIHNGYQFLPEGSVIEVNETGLVVAIHDGLENKEVISYEGILCPGFVNVHCHLELSHMKGMIPEHTGLVPFLQKVPSYRTMFSD